MNYTLRIEKSPEYQQNGNAELLIKNFNSNDEFQAVSKLLDNKKRICWLKSLVIPVRTDTLSNFCKDFFLPGLFNVAIKTKVVALKIFLCVFIPLYDVISFPLRLITVIPRCIYNAANKKEAHPFYQYLLKNGVAETELKAGHVYVEIISREEQKSSKYKNNYIETTTGNTFNFMELPRSVSNVRSHFSTRGKSCN